MTDTATAPPAIRSFPELGVDQRIADTLARDGITAPFAIQELTLPLALSGADVIGQARTGTGKTLAFGIPLLQRLDPAAAHVQALVIVPTRELCLQVHDDLALAGVDLGVKTVAVYGGKAIEDQTAALEAGAQVVVGTPGRLLDLMRRGILRLGGVRGLVLDEADEMLDMGFLPDVEQLIEACNDDRQTLLFSATMPSEVVGLARRYMHKPTFMRADVEEPRIAPETAQHFLSCHGMDKPAVLTRILQAPGRGLCVVFTRTKRMADTLVRELEERGVEASAIHSDLRQEARERTLRRFREGKVDVLCATEVAARGLDITDVTHVINYDCPDDEKMYLHRIGRTGRAGAAGVAVTLAVWNELARLEMIKKALEIDVPTHEVFSTSPLLDEIFELPPREVGKRSSGRSTSSQRGGASREGGGKRSSDGGGKRAGEGRGGKRGQDRRGGRDDEGGRNDEGTQRRTSGERHVKRTHHVGQRAEGEAAEATPSSERDGGGATDAPADAAAEPRKRVRRRVEAPTISAAERDDDGEPVAATRGAAPADEVTDGSASQGQTGTEDAASDVEETSPRRASTSRGAADSTQRQRVRQRTRQRDTSEDGDDDRARGGDASGDASAERSQAKTDEHESGDDADASQAERTDENGGASRSDRGSGRSRSRGGRGRGGSRGGRGGRGRSGGDREGSGSGAGRDRGASGSGEARTASQSGGKGGQQRGGNGNGGRSEQRGGDDGRSGEQRGGRGRSGGREQAPAAGNADASPPVGGVPSTAEARGEGTPALNRPLRIAHLP